MNIGININQIFYKNTIKDEASNNLESVIFSFINYAINYIKNN